jgi:RNA recognition motif-containing protein
VKNIYVGNLSFSVNEEQLRSMFEPYGQVDRVSIVTDRDSGQSRGFGFVEMSDDEAGNRAIEALNGTSVAGRNLTVNEARPKGERPRGGREGGFNRHGAGRSGGRGGSRW